MIPIFSIFYFFLFFHLMKNYASLPPMITTHYDAYGTAVKTLSKQDFATYHICFAVIISGIFPLIGYLISRIPPKNLILPHKDYWLAPERRQQTLDRLCSDFGWLGIVAGGTVVAVNHKIMAATGTNAHGLNPSDLRKILFWAGALMVFFLLRMIFRFRRPDEAVEEPAAQQETKKEESDDA